MYLLNGFIGFDRVADFDGRLDHFRSRGGSDVERIVSICEEFDWKSTQQFFKSVRRIRVVFCRFVENCTDSWCFEGCFSFCSSTIEPRRMTNTVGEKKKKNNTIPSSYHRTGVTSLFNPCSLVWWDSLYTNNLLQQPPDNLGAVKHDLKNASEYNSRWDNIFQHVTLTLHHWKKKKKQHNMKTRSLEVSSDGGWFTWRARTPKEKKKRPVSCR